MRVFQQAGTNGGYRRLHHIEESEKVLYQVIGQLRTQKGTQYHFVIRFAQGYLVELVGSINSSNISVQSTTVFGMAIVAFSNSSNSG